MLLKGLCDPDRYCYNTLLEVIQKYGLVHLMEMRLNEKKGFGWEFDKEMEEKGWFDERICSHSVFQNGGEDRWMWNDIQ